MRVVAFMVAFTLGVAGAVSCSPTKKCTPASCTGCCTSTDTCDPGNSTSSCGKGGNACDKCVASQLCTAGACESVTGTGGGSSGGGSTGGGTTGGGSAGNDITGTYQLLWGWDGDGGRTAVIPGFSRTQVGVWYRDGGNPDFKRGSGSDDGTFVIREVPSGEVTVQLDHRYFVTTARRLVFDSFNGGRKDAVPATQESTLRLTMRGLEPTNTNSNRAGFFFTQGGDIVTGLETVARPATPAGSTSIESDLDWVAVTNGVGVGLPDSAKGDKGWALQFHTNTTDAGSNTSLIRVAEFPAITLANGGSADAVADLTSPTGQPFTVTFDKPAFTALRGSFGRTAGTGFFSFSHGTSPTPAPHTIVGQAVVTLGSAVDDETATLPSLALATTFPSTWGRTVSAAYIVPQPRSILPDGGSPTSFSGGLSVSDLPAAFASALSPRLTPVRGAQISARNFIEDQTGVGTTPTVSWMAPATGMVSTYRLSINRLDTSGTEAEIWRIYTPNPSVTLPPNILVANNAYVFELEALAFGQGGISFTLPYAYSNVVSGVIRP